MHVDVAKRLFTVDDFYRMADAGIFTEDDRVELIDGEIIEMSPIGIRHKGCVNRANTFFTEAFGRNAVVMSAPQRHRRATSPAVRVCGAYPSKWMAPSTPKACGQVICL